MKLLNVASAAVLVAIILVWGFTHQTKFRLRPHGNDTFVQVGSGTLETEWLFCRGLLKPEFTKEKIRIRVEEMDPDPFEDFRYRSPTVAETLGGKFQFRFYRQEMGRTPTIALSLPLFTLVITLVLTMIVLNTRAGNKA